MKKCCNVRKNCSSIEYTAASAGEAITVDSNPVCTRIKKLCFSFTGCYSLHTCCGFYHITHVYSLINKNPYPLYDLRIDLDIPEELSLVPGSFMINGSKTELIHDGRIYLPVLPKQSSTRFCFQTFLPCSNELPLLLSRSKVYFCARHEDGKSFCKEAETEITKGLRKQ